MGRRLASTLVATVVTLAALGVVLVSRIPEQQPSLGAVAEATRRARAAQVTEQDWIVREIAGSLAVMAAYVPNTVIAVPTLSVSSEPLSGDAQFLSATFTVHTGPGFTQTMVLKDHVWSPATFQTFAARHFPQTPEAAGAGDPSLLAALTNPTTTVLLEQNQRVADRLRRNVRSAAAHEDAALLLGAFGLREDAARLFSDLRPVLVRLTAHLAAAAALRGDRPVSPNGRFAEIVLAMLVGRDAEALAALRARPIAASDSARQAWRRALELRITRDWRALKSPERATPLEQITYARLVRRHVSEGEFLAFFDRAEPSPDAGWTRLVMGYTRPSLEEGHRFVEAGLELELADQRQVWAALGRGDWMLDRLNQMPALGGVATAPHRADIQVLDWGLWAGFLQRHLASQLSAEWHFLRHTLSAAEDAKALPKQFEKRFGSLTLYPVVHRAIADDAEQYRWALAQAYRIPVNMLTAAAWRLLLDTPAFVEKPIPFPSDVAWFTPPVPAGTGFDLENRSLRENCERPAPLTQVERWAAMRPYDEWAVSNLLWRRHTGVPTVEEGRRVFGELLEYDVSPWLRMYRYHKASSDERHAVAVRLCEFDTGYCGGVAWHLLREGREQEAIDTFENWIGRSRSPVAIANNVGWLVRYYFANGRTDRAMELATRAYQTGSGKGMETYGELLDMMGRYAEAEQVFIEGAQRYEHFEEPLGAFYLRQHARSGDPANLERATTILSEIFPHGVERPPADALPAPPRDGVRLTDFGARAARAGLQPRDVIVMVDGIRVQTWRQYYVALRLSWEPQVLFTVWRDDRYHQLRLTVPERHFATGLETYLGQS